MDAPAADIGGVSELEPGFRVVDVSGSNPVCVACAGELDLATAPALGVVLELIEDNVAIDCRELTFIDSSGMSLLAREHARLTRHGHWLKLTALHGPPRRALEIIGMLDLLT